MQSKCLLREKLGAAIEAVVNKEIAKSEDERTRKGETAERKWTKRERLK